MALMREGVFTKTYFGILCWHLGDIPYFFLFNSCVSVDLYLQTDR